MTLKIESSDKTNTAKAELLSVGDDKGQLQL